MHLAIASHRLGVIPAVVLLLASFGDDPATTTIEFGP